ncbi:MULTISPECIES: HMA2 domain-containing protein [Allochromatium]|uniref:Heavy-metal-associated domain-containing protein n=2 Tax=Allochromatium TaxID=85072 RepID=A0A850RFZ0_9GAMM|nr:MULTISPECIES: heavy-metal-associated domain-containing protein [Allochromatium]NVZ10317.1 heavy-metal-associated domain-containing protein [Allochromatium humboldtianum]BCU07365.1 hypothetical protein Atep_20420 [Allochromatium tepidum]
MHHSIHHVPGRLRVRSAAFRCRPGTVDSAQAQLRALDGVEQIRFNRAAGSLVIHYDPARLDHHRLLEMLKETGCADLSSASEAVISKAGALFGKALVGAVVNKAVERSAFRLVSVLL